jgi:hypothetical protein
VNRSDLGTWFQLYVAALAGGRSVLNAAKMADEALEIYRARCAEASS